MNNIYHALLSDTSGIPDNNSNLSEGAHISVLRSSEISIILDWNTQILTQIVFYQVIGISR